MLACLPNSTRSQGHQKYPGVRLIAEVGESLLALFWGEIAVYADGLNAVLVEELGYEFETALPEGEDNTVKV